MTKPPSAWLICLCLFAVKTNDAFTFTNHPRPFLSIPSPPFHFRPRRRIFSSSSLSVRLPQSPYFHTEPTVLPSTYDPVMEFPGTMRPTRARENSPYEDLPLTSQTSEKDLTDPTDLNSIESLFGGGTNIPWPHFQDLPWHVNWGAVHPPDIPIVDFIGSVGRWLTREEEDEIDAGYSTSRSGMREEEKEVVKVKKIIMDDDDEDDDDVAGRSVCVGGGGEDEYDKDDGEGGENSMSGVLPTNLSIKSISKKMKASNVFSGADEPDNSFDDPLTPAERIARRSYIIKADGDDDAVGKLKALAGADHSPNPIVKEDNTAFNESEGGGGERGGSGEVKSSRGLEVDDDIELDDRLF